MRSILTLCVVALLSIACLSGGAAAADTDSGETMVVDSIGEHFAVLLVESDDPTQQLVFVDTLPEEAHHEGAVVTIENGDFVYLAEETETREEEAEERLDELSERL